MLDLRISLVRKFLVVDETGDEDVFNISGRSNVTELGVRRLPLIITNKGE